MRTVTIIARGHGSQTASAQAAPALAGSHGEAVVDLPFTVRRATAVDDVAVARLAALDSADVPSGPLLLAESNGELRAALSLRDGEAIADPFHHTAAIVDLLAALATPALARRRTDRRLRGRGRRL
jgi:hypothetical protein